MSPEDAAVREPIEDLAGEWRRVFDAAVRARSAYHALAADPAADLERIDRARELYEQSAAAKNKLLDRIDLLDHRVPRT